MKKSIEKVIIGFLMVLCLLVSYKIARNYFKEEIKIDNQVKTNVADVNTNNQEISLGDSIDHCSSHYCVNGYSYDTVKKSCYVTTWGDCDGRPSNACPTTNWVNGCCRSSTRAYKPEYVRCNECEENYVKNGDDTVCGTCSISVVATEHVSPGENINVSLGWAGTACGGLTVSLKSGSNVASKSSTVNLTDVADNSEGGSQTVKFTAGNKKCTSATISYSGAVEGSVSSEVVNTWKNIGTLVLKAPLAYDNKYQANLGGGDTFGSCALQPNNMYLCTGVESRSCSPPKSVEEKACYGDAQYLSLVSKQPKWIYPTEAKALNLVKIENVANESQCHVAVPRYCSPDPYCSVQSTSTKGSCESKVVIKYQDGKECSESLEESKNKVRFYTIKCDNTVETKFDNGDDGESTKTTNSIYVGQGFKYSMTISTKRKCTATFDKAGWQSLYDKFIKKIAQYDVDLKDAYAKKVDTETINKIISNKNTRIKQLKDTIQIINAYNSYNPAKTYNEQAVISLDYKVNGKKTNINSNFEMVVLEPGKGEYISKTKVNIEVSNINKKLKELGITEEIKNNPYNYEWSNENNVRTVKLILPKTYLDAETGEVTNKPGIDGGNKLYVSYNANVGTYDLKVNVSGIGCNSKIENNKCKIKIKDKDIIYRPIDVSNPFINNKWTPGTNWLNSQFDFRNIIKSNIWSSSECYSKYSNSTWGNC